MRTCVLSARVTNHVDEGSNTFYVIEVGWGVWGVRWGVRGVRCEV